MIIPAVHKTRRIVKITPRFEVGRDNSALFFGDGVVVEVMTKRWGGKRPFPAP
jgi:hypothetical protein